MDNFAPNSAHSFRRTVIESIITSALGLNKYLGLLNQTVFNHSNMMPFFIHPLFARISDPVGKFSFGIDFSLVLATEGELLFT